MKIIKLKSCKSSKKPKPSLLEAKRELIANRYTRDESKFRQLVSALVRAVRRDLVPDTVYIDNTDRNVEATIKQAFCSHLNQTKCGMDFVCQDCGKWC